MTPEELDLARALVALDAWEWRAGMLPLRHCGPAGRLATETEHGGRLLTVVSGQRFPADALLDYCWPDLTDWPTVGALLGLLNDHTRYAEHGVMADSRHGLDADGNVDRGQWVKSWRCVDSSRHVIITVAEGPSPGVAVARALLAVLS